MKKAHLSRGIVLRLFPVIIAGLLTVQNAHSQGWYDAGWPFRCPVTVSGLTAAQSDFQVEITLDNGFDFINTLDEASDLRVTASDGLTPLPFWVEEWDRPGASGRLWVRLPELPTTGVILYLYYGNPSPPPPGELTETPPAGPFTKAEGNPGVINGAGAPGSTEAILPENIVYDPDTELYWMVLSDQTGGPYVGLVYSDNPTDPDSWNWSGYPISGNLMGIAPHLMEHDGTWYIFYGDRSVASPYPISVATSPDVDGPYTYQGPVLPAGASGTWEDARADEPYVFWSASLNKWVLIYMGDAGGNVEQVGYATADNITGPYTKFAGNPCIPFGPAGTYDAGTVADPWVYEFNGVYYIGYTVSPTTSSPWQTALATTSDWTTFTKHGIILPRGGEYNSFRGAVTRIGDEYVFPYTGGPSAGAYRLCIATQPVFQYIAGEVMNSGEAVFDFFDGFEGSGLDLSKWNAVSGAGLVTIDDGQLSMNATSIYVLLRGISQFGVSYRSETRARHASAGVFRLISEFGFSDVNWNTIRIADYYLDNQYWQRQAKLAGGADEWINMAQTADTDWHKFNVFRQSPGTAGFCIDNNPVETTLTNVPDMDLSPFLMSYGSGNQVLVDWTRVRKWAGTDPVSTVGPQEGFQTRWTGSEGSDWDAPDNWTAGVPGQWGSMVIGPSSNIPVISGTLTIASTARLAIEPGGALTVGGDLINNGQVTIDSDIASSGSLIVSGSSTGSVTYGRQLKTGNSEGSDWHLAAPSVLTNSDGNAGKITALYQWSEPTGLWTSTGITSILAGRGYNINQEPSSDGVISFTGPLANGDITVEASSPYADAVSGDANYFTRLTASGRNLESQGGMGWNLLGNPYPSAINAEAFISGNYSATPALSQFDPSYVALYLFDGTTRQYYYLANSTGWPSGSDLGGTHIQAGQGFFVLAMNDNSVFRFTKAMQEHNTATAMLKSSATDSRWPGLQLKVKHGTGEAVTTVVYGEAMTPGIDPGYDVGLFRSGRELEIYTSLVAKDNGIPYSRQALPVTGSDTLVIPVGIDLIAGGEVTFSAMTIPLEGRRFWLEDRTAGIFTDLGTKSYTVNLTANISGAGRFYLISSANTPTDISATFVHSNPEIWISERRVNIKGDLSDEAICSLIDMKGRIIFETNLSGGSYNVIEVPPVVYGLVVVRVTDRKTTTTRKVLIR